VKPKSKKVLHTNYRSIRASWLSTDQVGLSNNNPHWNLGFRFLFFPDLIQVLRDLKVTHPSLERLESDSSKSWETWKWLKVTHPSLERLESDSSKSRETWKWLIQVLRDLKVTHPSLERLENDSSKSWETWKWLIKKINHIQAPDVLGFGEGALQKTGILQSFYRSGKVCTRCVEHSSIPHLWCPA